MHATKIIALFATVLAVTVSATPSPQPVETDVAARPVVQGSSIAWPRKRDEVIDKRAPVIIARSPRRPGGMKGPRPGPRRGGGRKGPGKPRGRGPKKGGKGGKGGVRRPGGPKRGRKGPKGGPRRGPKGGPKGGPMGGPPGAGGVPPPPPPPVAPDMGAPAPDAEAAAGEAPVDDAPAY